MGSADFHQQVLSGYKEVCYFALCYCAEPLMFVYAVPSLHSACHYSPIRLPTWCMDVTLKEK